VVAVGLAGGAGVLVGRGIGHIPIGGGRTIDDAVTGFWVSVLYSEDAEDDLANERDFDRSLAKGDTNRKIYRPRPTDQVLDEDDVSSALDDLESISGTRDRHIDTGHPEKINKIDKAIQKLKKALKDVCIPE
jgi:hypothetical protein